MAASSSHQHLWKTATGKKAWTTKEDIHYTVRPLTMAEIPKLMDIRRQVGGIEVESCVRSFLTMDPGCITMAITNAGEIIGTASTAKNGDDVDAGYFGGIHYVKPEFRSKGIGFLVWDICSKHVGPDKNLSMNVVPELLDVYLNKIGPEVYVPFYEDNFRSVEYRIPSSDCITTLSNTPPPGINIQDFDPSLFPVIFAYDHALIGFPRTDALRLSMLEPGSSTLVAITNGNASCAGFGTVKITCAGDVRVGPLYADGPEVAEVLFRRLVDMKSGEAGAGIVFVTTSGNSHVKEWMERNAVRIWKMCHRLYTKKNPEVDLEKVFAMTDVNFASF